MIIGKSRNVFAKMVDSLKDDWIGGQNEYKKAAEKVEAARRDE